MRLAIIGGGFSTAAVLRQLVRQRVALQSLTIFEPRPELGEGVAYGDASDELVLNTRAVAMGVDPDHPDDFARWAGLAGGEGDTFVPRRRYAAYLRHCVEVDTDRAAFPVIRRRARVQSVVRACDRFLVAASDAGEAFDAVVLAIGTLPPAPVPYAHACLAADGRFVERVWESDWLARVRPDDHLVVLGTGLTMVDLLQRLWATGHRGVVTAVSRRGQLPHVHAALHAIYPAQHVADIASLPLRALMRSLRRAAEVADDWRNLLDALRPHHRAIWLRLAASERRAFLRHLRPWWDTHRHRLAPDVDALVAQARVEGRLRIMAGTLRGAMPHHGRIAVSVRPRGRDADEVLEADLLLRATGFDLAVAPGRDSLLDSLLCAALITPDPLGLGIRASNDCQVLDPLDQPVTGLYVLGPLLAGCWWEATAVPDIRVDARTLVARLAQEVVAPRESIPS